MTLTTDFDFDYVVTGITTSGEVVTEEGRGSSSADLGYGNERGVFNEAVAFIMDHFYTMRIEKEGRQIVEATVTVKNFRFR